jgi:hypothetical protein
MEKERQERVLRWVAESLNLDLGLLRQREGQAHGSGALTEDLRAPPAGSLPSGRLPQQADIKTFVDTKKPKSDVLFAAVVAYYHRFEAPARSRKEAIDRQILREAARLAGRRWPPKPRATLNNAKTLGYLDSVERGQFRINSVGCSSSEHMQRFHALAPKPAGAESQFI